MPIFFSRNFSVSELEFPWKRAATRRDERSSTSMRAVPCTDCWGTTKRIAALGVIIFGLLMVTLSMVSGFGLSWGVVPAVAGFTQLTAVTGVKFAASFYLIAGALLTAIGAIGLTQKRTAALKPASAIEPQIRSQEQQRDKRQHKPTKRRQRRRRVEESVSDPPKARRKVVELSETEQTEVYCRHQIKAKQKHRHYEPRDAPCHHRTHRQRKKKKYEYEYTETH